MAKPPLSPAQLPSSLRQRIDYSILPSTRIHKLATVRNTWVKREDELSAAVSGSKLRKYASLIPHLKKNVIELVGMIGGPNSNNLVGLAQKLKENGIKPLAFIREPADPTLSGNALLLNMLLAEDERVFVSRSDWKLVENIAQAELDSRGSSSTLIPEGCFCEAALWGALTLAESVLENEVQKSLLFERLYIDSGTGLSAIGLIMGLELLSPHSCSQREVVVTILAGEELAFRERLDEMRKLLSASIDNELPHRCRIAFTKPPVAAKFGSVNPTLLQACQRIARREGLLLDPTYSLKHFLSMEAQQVAQPTNAPALFIFNGSALGLMGFQQRLASLATD